MARARTDAVVIQDDTLFGGSNAQAIAARASARRMPSVGSKALAEVGSQSPLKQFGFTKADIRAASRQLGLPTAEKPAMACLASRFPYGAQITQRGLTTVERAELAAEFTIDLNTWKTILAAKSGHARLKKDEIERLSVVFVKDLESIVAAVDKA